MQRHYGESLLATVPLVREIFSKLSSGFSVSEVAVGSNNQWVVDVIIDAFKRYPELPVNFDKYSDELNDLGRGMVARYVSDRSAIFLIWPMPSPRKFLKTLLSIFMASWIVLWMRAI